jgi:hypothetical protein
MLDRHEVTGSIPVHPTERTVLSSLNQMIGRFSNIHSRNIAETLLVLSTVFIL